MNGLKHWAKVVIVAGLLSVAFPAMLILCAVSYNWIASVISGSTTATIATAAEPNFTPSETGTPVLDRATAMPRTESILRDAHWQEMYEGQFVFLVFSGKCPSSTVASTHNGSVTLPLDEWKRIEVIRVNNAMRANLETFTGLKDNYESCWYQPAP